MENDGTVIEIPVEKEAPKKGLVEARQFLLTDQERVNVLAICDIALKATGIRGVADIMTIVAIFK